MEDHPKYKPPKWAHRCLRWYCPDSLLEEVEGDLLENFHRNLNRKTLFHARVQYSIDVIRFFNPTTFKKGRQEGAALYYHRPNPIVMLRNYLKIALRNLWKDKETSFINISGLAVGLCGFLLISLFIFDEWQFDRFHPEADRTFRLYTEAGGSIGASTWAGSSPALSPALQETFPEVEQSLRLYQIRQKMLFAKDGDSYLEDKGFFAESSVFEIFHLPFLFGDPATALTKPDEVVLSAGLAKKYFGATDPVGKVLKIQNQEITVAGVLAPLSPHFHLEFEYLFSFHNLLDQVSVERMNSWVWQDFLSYVQLHSEAERTSLQAKLPAFVEEKAHPQTKERGFHYYLHLQALPEIHLHSSGFTNDVAIRGNYRYMVGLAFVGIFLLLIACINFINLATARAVRRFKEVGVRKVSGALRSQLAFQFIIEAAVVVALAMLAATQLVRFLLPFLNDFTGKEMSFPLFSQPLLAGALLLLTLVIGLVAGSYPAFIQSGFRPVAALKGAQFKPGGHVQWLRKGLVVLQFTLSILLIISVSIISRQINFLSRTDLGFQKEQLVHFPMKGKIFQNIETSKAEFMAIPGVTSVSTCFGIPGDIVAGDEIIIPGEDRRTMPARLFSVDHDYQETMGMKLVAGRFFSKANPTDATEGFIVNETAVQALGLGQTPEEAIDKPLEWRMWTDQDTIKKGRVIGVIQDFNYASLHEPIQSAILQIYPDSWWKMVLKIKTEDLPSTLASIENTWDRFETGYPIDQQFVDASFGAMYEEEQKLSGLLWGLYHCSHFYCLYWSFWAGYLHYGAAPKGDWHSQGPGSKCAGDRWYAFPGFFTIGRHRHPGGITGSLVFYAAMVEGFCLSGITGMVGICFGRPCGHPDRLSYCWFPKH